MPKDSGTYCVDVDLSHRNASGGDPSCDKPGHAGKGPHFDITIHLTSCPLVDGAGKECGAERFLDHCPSPPGVGRHFSTLAGAEQWALVQKAHHADAFCWVGVRHCRTCLPQCLNALPAE